MKDEMLGIVGNTTRSILRGEMFMNGPDNKTVIQIVRGLNKE